MGKKSQRSSAALEVKKQGGGFNHNFTSEAHSVQVKLYQLKNISSVSNFINSANVVQV